MKESADHTAAMSPKLFPRWKECILLFAILTAATVFVPQVFASVIFCVVSAVICWRAFGDERTWTELIFRFGLAGVLVGSILWLFAVHLQRNGLVRLSRD